MWADAICINQQSNVEQAQQISLMAQIYERASQVLIWLGDDEFGDAKISIDTILSINQCFDAGFAHRDNEDDEEFFPEIPEGSHLLEEDKWQAMSHMFDMPWFSRVWVIQEVGLAADALMLYGDTSILWSEVIQFIISVDKQIDLNSVPVTLSIGPTIDAFNMIWRSYDNPRSWRTQLRHVAKPTNDFAESHFFNILLTGSWMGATDPRDRVYAFLGHPAAQRNEGRNTIVNADYDISKEQLYTELTIKTAGGVRVTSCTICGATFSRDHPRRFSLQYPRGWSGGIGQVISWLWDL